MTMGDGSLYCNTLRNGNPCGNYKMDIAHCFAQEPYLNHKRDIVNEIFDYDIPITTKHITNNRTGKKYMARKFATRTHSRLSFIAKNIYIDGKKRITDWVLDNITTEGLAYWWMDDGCLHMDKRENHGGGRIIWGLYGFPTEDVIKFQQWLDANVGVNLRLHFHQSGGPFLQRGISEGVKLLDSLKEYSVPCMDYKFDVGCHKRPYYNLMSSCYSTGHPIKDDDIVHPVRKETHG